MTKDQGKPLIAIPTYNELGSLPSLVAEIFRHLPHCEILVIDDHSPDGTGRWCDEYAQSEPRLKCIHRQGKGGIGSALLAGLRYAEERGYRLVVTMDADFSHAPAELPRLVAAMDSGPVQAPVDVAIASRYTKGGGVEGWSLRRRLMSRLVNLVARWLLGLRVRDCSTGFRCYRTAAVKPLLNGDFFARGYAFEEEILFRLQRQDASFDEVPSRFVNRDRGGSKLNTAEAIKAGWVLLRLAVGRFWPCSTC